MSDLNPIERITDPTFTSSSKGLMTLFCIGVAHQVIGIKITESQIAIPWLPKVEFLHPEKLSILFIVLVLYAVFRYLLHQKPTLKELNIRALKEGLSSNWIGKWFVFKYILHHNDKPLVIEGESPVIKGCRAVSLGTFQENNSPASEWFYLEFDDSTFVNRASAQVHIALGRSQKPLNDPEIPKYWGKFNTYDTDAENETFSLNAIESFWLRALLILINLYFTLGLMKRSPLAFDFLLPVILNLGLVIHFFVSLT
ncbi:hypothetical protein LMH78_01360 [Vibrio lentus]|uniref:hypothetical protein n=1 Tax=Vibrio lentus TaxID=136468 RepID=UPI001E518600|nr:hypothetical protein [Vibrio lentus]MCC4854439.1 hypothetical protein [Vibrio lentus]